VDCIAEINPEIADIVDSTIETAPDAAPIADEAITVENNGNNTGSSAIYIQKI
jgi:hypothetical protein